MADTNDDDILAFARAAYSRDEDHWNPIYESAEKDLHFLSDDPYAQWDSNDIAERRSANRPALTIDQLSQFIHQVANNIRMNTPSVNVLPANDGDVDTAEIFKGLIKNIEYASNADEAYDTASNFSIKCSIGFIRVDHDYENDIGFDQVLKICRVVNPMAIYLDSNSIESDGRDAKHAIVLEKLTVKEFKDRYPNFEVSSFESSDKDMSTAKDDEEVTIAEVFRILEDKRTIKVTDDGEESDYNDGDEDQPSYKAKRSVTKSKVMRYKLSGRNVLEQTTFPGKYIPIVPVYGEEAWEAGERKLFSLIRKSKGAQQMYNVWKSLETELIMKQPNAPVMVGEGQIEDYAADWKDPTKSMALRYKTHNADGLPLPAPIRLQPPGVPAGIVNAARETVDDIKATMGLYNASLGQRSNETSGKAIDARKIEGDTATYHFGDNLVRSITQIGRVLVSAIPEIYDTARIIRIIGVEDEPQKVGVNGAPMQSGQKSPFDLTKGQYDVRVVTGASYSTKREEAAQFFTNVVKQNPELMQVMGDLLFKNMDFSGAQAMASRMKKLIDPKLLSPEERQAQQQDNQDAPDPEKQKMAAVIQQLQQALQQAQGEIQSKQMDAQMKQMELQAKLQESQMKTQQVQIKAQTDQAATQTEAQGQQIDATMKSLEMQLKKAQLVLDQEEIQLRAIQLRNERYALENPPKLSTDNASGKSPSPTKGVN